MPGPRRGWLVSRHQWRSRQQDGVGGGLGEGLGWGGAWHKPPAQPAGSQALWPPPWNPLSTVGSVDEQLALRPGAVGQGAPCGGHRPRGPACSPTPAPPAESRPRPCGSASCCRVGTLTSLLVSCGLTGLRAWLLCGHSVHPVGGRSAPSALVSGRGGGLPQPALPLGWVRRRSPATSPLCNAGARGRHAGRASYSAVSPPCECGAGVTLRLPARSPTCSPPLQTEIPAAGDMPRGTPSCQHPRCEVCGPRVGPEAELGVGAWAETAHWEAGVGWAGLHRCPVGARTPELLLGVGWAGCVHLRLVALGCCGSRAGTALTRAQAVRARLRPPDGPGQPLDGRWACAPGLPVVHARPGR
nr:uncharacterized protein LOC108176272 isoform X1 [Oryctolagus cuniculus]XP_051686478.1 uncharacterized protein LOC108176272 isoform X1 [Oryctolagus cuniculus]XP_051686479.1 uncharacterized protein LOC108176272 isoform X1 [Oryctolagus cuniculus]XP_051686480.1 uncharacterized protein LOC108176272 isoform X2 [Oryctolagus cuniculus]XP_051686482.1 uncharacterized protein LOC108176272 isoform X3 [Oryctolagus cuniculus]XP_051686483.1 uncharacterized protein LOC108176272 isoform X2 [Oryctolagus cuni